MDWEAAKTEYITTDSSYRQLAEKYGVDYRALGRQAKKQGWVAERDKHRQEVRQQAVEQATEKKIDRLLRFQKLTDKLLGKVEIFIEQADPKALDARALRSITAALKDMKEIQAVRSEAELREQELRLRLLERQEADSRADRKFIVQIEGGEEVGAGRNVADSCAE